MNFFSNKLNKNQSDFVPKWSSRHDSPRQKKELNLKIEKKIDKKPEHEIIEDKSSDEECKKDHFIEFYNNKERKEEEY